MNSQNPAVTHYLEQFRSGLRQLPAAEQAELVREIENHIAEATSNGQSVADVLVRLGPPEKLARAYTADAILSGRTGGSRPRRWLAVVGVLALTSIPSLIIIPLLAGLGLGLTLGGIGAVLAVLIDAVVPYGQGTLLVGIVGLDYSQAQALAVAIAFCLGAAGVGSFMLLRKYLQFLVGQVKAAMH